MAITQIDDFMVIYSSNSLCLASGWWRVESSLAS